MKLKIKAMNKVRKFDLKLFMDSSTILLLLFASGTCYTSIHQPGVYLVTFFVLAIMLVFQRKKVICGKSAMLLCIFLVLSVLTAVFNVDADVVSYMGYFITLLIGFCACNLVEKDRFYEIFLDIILFFCVFSLVMTAISNIKPSFIMIFPVSKYRNLHTIYGLHTFLGIYLSQINRNCGPFREPGVFEVYLNLALIIAMFKHATDKRRLIKILLIVITIISTESSTGILAMAAIFGGYIFYKPQIRDKLVRKLKMVMWGGFIITIIAVLTIPALFLQKLDSASGSYQSYLVRYVSTITDIKLWLDAPVFGQGITMYESLFAGTSNSVTSSLAIFGFIFTFFEIALVWKFIKRIVAKKEGVITQLCLVVAIIVIFCTQPILFFPFIQTMLFFEANETLGGKKITENYRYSWNRYNLNIEGKL